MADEGQVSIRSEADVVEVRRIIREVATRLGFGITDVTRIVTAASELARNIVSYAGAGSLQWRHLESGGDVGLELIFSDSGPGIADPELALRRGYSTGGGLGLGLPGAQRLMDGLEIESEIGKGTRVTTRKWLSGTAVHR